MQQWTTCSLSGEQIENPVISKISGHIYEKRLIEKHVESTSTCPITGRPMALDDLIPIKVHPVQKPRPLTATSIPALLSHLQNEWDTLMLEQFQLKQHLETVRQELTHALYQHDAACRVIARLIKERDQARTDLAQLQERVNNQKGGNMETEEDNLPAQVVQDVESKAIELNSQRKQRRKQTNWVAQYPSAQQLQNFGVKTSIPVDGVTAIDTDLQNENFIVVGTITGAVQVIDRNDNRVLATIKQHTKRVTTLHIANVDENLRIVSVSEDGYLYAYKYENPGKLTVTYTYQASDAITGLFVHPIRYMVLIGVRDGSFSFHDIQNGTLLKKYTQFQRQIQIASVAIHPDGHFAAFGASDGTIKIWKISSGTLMAQLEGHQSTVDRLAFSESGTNLASSSTEEGFVNIWDLRSSEIKATIFKDSPQPVGSLQFDESTQYLVIGCKDSLLLVETKKWTPFGKITGSQGLITDVRQNIMQTKKIWQKQSVYSNQFSGQQGKYLQ